MHPLIRGAGRWAAVCLLAGLCWCAPASRLCAQPIPPDKTVPPEATSSAPPAQAEAPQPFWAKVPDLEPQPRPGLFLMPPSGCGYYTGLDALRREVKDKPPFYPYRGFDGFFDNDFRYLDKTDGQPYDVLDDLKRIHFGSPFNPGGNDWMLSIGGEERLQIKDETDSRLTTTNNKYQLLRTRVYADLWYRDDFRVYVEFIDAESFNQSLPPLAIDVNHGDLLDAFCDVKLGDINDHPVYARIGRQELCYGSQRLISTLDWANTRRTFDGAKLFWHGDKLDVDAFWTRPVLVSPGKFDSADANRQFAGLWTTYKPVKGQFVDLYYLYLDSDLPVGLGRLAGGRAGYNLNTFGARYSGDHKVEGNCRRASPGSLLWDCEGAYQFGDYSARDVSAGMLTGGLGWFFSEAPMQPQLWAYIDYASGTPHLTNPATGEFETFNQLFPFGHYYFGYLDEVGRENITDINFQAAAYPAKWITLWGQYHIFNLVRAADALYGTSPGYPVNRFSPTGAAGRDVGEELDIAVSFQLGRHSNVLLGYSKLYEGDFIRLTGPSVSPELIYGQYSFRW
jgi:hypothetical protein